MHDTWDKKNLAKFSESITKLQRISKFEYVTLRALLRLILGKKKRDQLIADGILNIDLIMKHFMGKYAFELFDDKHFLISSDGFRLVITWHRVNWLPNICQKIMINYLKPKPNDVVIDAGAHYGFYALPASRLVGKDGLVLGFEPATRNYRGLLANLHLNNIGNVRPFNMALGDFDGEVKLYLGKRSGLHSIIYQRSQHSEVVPIKKIDTIVDELGLSKVNLIKLDTEGAELKILEGALSTIKKFRPRLTIAAYHHCTESDEIVEWLKENASFYNIQREIGPEGKFVHAL